MSDIHAEYMQVTLEQEYPPPPHQSGTWWGDIEDMCEAWDEGHIRNTEI